MANTIIGKVLMVGEAVNISKKSEFYKRELVLDISRYDQFTGEKKENYVKFSFEGKHCEDLDFYKVGDLVEVSFVFNGRIWESDGIKKYIVDVVGYKIERREKQSAQPEEEQPTVEQSVETTQKQGDLPF